MKKLIVTASCIAVGLCVAMRTGLAADMALKAPPPAPASVCNWCGWYVGANGGYGWGNSTGNIDPNFPNVFGAAAAVASGFIPSNLAVRPQGGFGGGQIGYNWQSAQWVWGLEADIQGSAIKNNSTVLFAPAGVVGSTTTTSDNLNWFGTARLRAGVLASPNLLLYGTGGLAYGHVGENVAIVGNPAASALFVGSGSQTRLGWSAGAGAEWMVTNNISLKAEYLFVDLGRTSVTTTDPLGVFPGAFFAYNFKSEFNMVRAGVDWHFGGLAVAK
jgi:outer membrane immunogenic protein